MPVVGDRYLEYCRHSHEVRQRSSAHLLHDLAAVNLDSDLADLELGRRLFVEETADDQR